MIYVFDACALLAYLNQETGWETIDELLYQAEQGDAIIYMNIVNFIEVYYDRLHYKTAQEVRDFLAYVDASPIYLINTISLPIIHLHQEIGYGIGGV